MKFALTPEFHRNLWLKFSPFRLIAAPVFIAACSIICLNIIPDKGVIFERDYSYSMLLNGSRWFFFLIVIIWGNYEAGTAMQEEIKGNTWDFQRMSSVTPLQLVVGKLFGSTSYVWYVGLLTLIPFYYGLGHVDAHEIRPMYNYSAGQPIEAWNPNNDLYAVLYLILAGLMGHAVAFLISFIDLTSFIAKTGKKRVPRGSAAFAFGVIASWCVFAMAEGVSPKLAEFSSMFRDFPVSVWFGNTYDSAAFVTCSFVFFLAWAVIGSYRIARAELMHRTMPVMWPAFVSTVLVYVWGFSDPNSAYYFVKLLGLFMLSLALCYGVMLFEATDGRKYARFAGYLQQGDLRRTFENTHKWVVTVPFVLLCYVATLQHVPSTGKYITFEAMAGFMVAVIMFAIRDGLIIHAAIRGKGGRNIGFKIMFYYVTAYLVLPVLHFTFMPKSLNPTEVSRWMRLVLREGGEGDLPEMVKSLAMWYPLPLPELSLSVGPVALQVALAGAWLFISLRNAKEAQARR